MKRILPAAVLAIIFHTALLGVDVSYFTDRTIVMPRSTAVTVTMSYRQPEPGSEVKDEPVKRRKIEPEEAIKIPEEPNPLPREELVRISDEKESPPSEEKAALEELEESEVKTSNEVDFPEDSQGDAVANMQITREAVPLYKVNPPPKYPRVAKRRGYQGTVVLSVFVSEDGRVENLWVYTSSGYRLLDNAAIKAVKKWTFEPGIRGNKKVEMSVNIPVRFELK